MCGRPWPNRGRGAYWTCSFQSFGQPELVSVMDSRLGDLFPLPQLLPAHLPTYHMHCLSCLPHPSTGLHCSSLISSTTPPSFSVPPHNYSASSSCNRPTPRSAEQSCRSNTTLEKRQRVVCVRPISGVVGLEGTGNLCKFHFPSRILKHPDAPFAANRSGCKLRRKYQHSASSHDCLDGTISAGGLCCCSQLWMRIQFPVNTVFDESGGGRNGQTWWRGGA